MCVESSFWVDTNWPNIGKMAMTLQLSGIPLFDAVLSLFFRLVTGPNFMSISSQVLGWWKFSFIRYWPEICESEIRPSEFYPISWRWSKLGIPNLPQMSPTKCYLILQDNSVTFSELAQDNQESKVKMNFHPKT